MSMRPAQRVVRVATCAYPIEHLASLFAYRDKQARLVQEAKHKGAQLLVFPEYGSLELGSLLTSKEQESLHSELNAVQSLLPAMLEIHATLAKTHGVYILGPSFPERMADGHVRNRARMHAPTGSVALVEKQQLTPFEREEWEAVPGRTRVIETELGAIGVAICYDSEFPLIVRRQVEAGAEIILVPSCTDALAGYHRVSISCRARALENQCYVVQAATVGVASWSHAIDDNHGAAALYGPMDYGHLSDGIVAQGPIDVPGWVIADLDLGALATVRTAGQVRNHRDWSEDAHLHGDVERVSLR